MVYELDTVLEAMKYNKKRTHSEDFWSKGSRYSTYRFLSSDDFMQRRLGKLYHFTRTPSTRRKSIIILLFVRINKQSNISFGYLVYT